MLGRTDSRLRLVVFLCGMALFAAMLGGRLAYWQLGQADQLRGLAEAQLSRPTSTEIRRGDISDRRGTLLATTAYRDLLAAHPDLIRDPARREEIARRLARLLEFGSTETEALVASFAKDVPYFIVARQLTDVQSQQVRQELASGALAALSLEPRPVRFYPNPGASPGTTLASQLLGFVTEDGEGQYGVEQRNQELLAGRSGVTAAVDDVLLPASGASLHLTIDASLQLRVEKELHAAWVANRAQAASAVVIDPYTGAILAWASVPGYDANAYGATAGTQPELFLDPLASQLYEPGSVMKMFTAATALEQGVVDQQTPIKDELRLRFDGGVEVHNADRRSMGRMTFEDVIAYSRNVATGKVAMKLGQSTAESAALLYAMWERLGLGRPTGIELSNEAAGLVRDPAEHQWQKIDLVNRAFGQGVAVTPLQLAVAFSAMVNGGLLVQPHVLQAVDGTDQPPAEPVQVLDPQLSDRLRELMVHVVTAVPHYAETTLIPGYLVGGKTGTAQIWDADEGRWKESTYNHTFAGFVGRDRPDAVIVVRIHEAEPRVKRRAGHILEVTSNELFRRIAQGVTEVLDLPPLAAPARPADELPDEAPEDEPDFVPTAPPGAGIRARWQ